MRVKTLYSHKEGKAAFLVQRGRLAIYIGYDKVVCRPAPLTKLIQLVQADDQRLEPFLYFTDDRNSSDSCVYFFFNNFLKNF